MEIFPHKIFLCFTKYSWNCLSLSGFGSILISVFDLHNSVTFLPNQQRSVALVDAFSKCFHQRSAIYTQLPSYDAKTGSPQFIFEN